MISLIILLPLALIPFFLLVAFVQIRIKFYKLRRLSHTDNKAEATKPSPSSSSISTCTIAFFHPHCSGGGGGERVLWKAVESISDLNEELLGDDNDDGRGDVDGRKGHAEHPGKQKQLQVVIYTSDAKSMNYKRGETIFGKFDEDVPFIILYYFGFLSQITAIISISLY